MTIEFEKLFKYQKIFALKCSWNDEKRGGVDNHKPSKSMNSAGVQSYKLIPTDSLQIIKFRMEI